MRVARSGKLFDCGAQRLHQFAKIIEMLGEREGLPGKGDASGDPPEYKGQVNQDPRASA